MTAVPGYSIADMDGITMWIHTGNGGSVVNSHISGYFLSSGSNSFSCLAKTFSFPQSRPASPPLVTNRLRSLIQLFLTSLAHSFLPFLHVLLSISPPPVFGLRSIVAYSFTMWHVTHLQLPVTPASPSSPIFVRPLPLESRRLSPVGQF